MALAKAAARDRIARSGRDLFNALILAGNTAAMSLPEFAQIERELGKLDVLDSDDYKVEIQS